MTSPAFPSSRTSPVTPAGKSFTPATGKKRSPYRGQFGWSPSDLLDMGEMGTYQVFNTGGEAIGGMMNSPGMPRPAWLTYFNVDDIEAAKARLEAAGGQVLMGPVEVPGGHWIVQATDPQQAMFALVGPRR